MKGIPEIRSIPGHPRYGASPDGRIWSSCRGPWRQMKLSLDRKGQPKVNVDEKTYKVHTLIALTFLGPRPAKHDIDHKDGDKQNCAVSNLEYCTRSENIIRALKAGRQPRPPAWVYGAKKTRLKQKRRLLSERRNAQAIELGIRQIPRHPKYGVTADGQAWSFARRKTWRKLVHVACSRGFPKVKLGGVLTVSVHDLVARMFLGLRPEGAVVLHLDGDRWNAAADNLRYVSKSEDNRLAWAKGAQRSGWPTRTRRLRVMGHDEWGPSGSYPSQSCETDSQASSC